MRTAPPPQLAASHSLCVYSGRPPRACWAHLDAARGSSRPFPLLHHHGLISLHLFVSLLIATSLHWTCLCPLRAGGSSASLAVASSMPRTQLAPKASGSIQAPPFWPALPSEASLPCTPMSVPLQASHSRDTLKVYTELHPPHLVHFGSANLWSISSRLTSALTSPARPLSFWLC